MRPDISELRKRFIDPPMSCRHLAIIHAFGRHGRMPWQPNPVNGDEQPSLKDHILRRLTRLVEWGFGGVVANVGRSSYLEDEEEWRVFLAGFAAAKELGMRFWIYDEDGYPSGAAGGIVLRDHPQYEAQSLVRMRETFDGGEIHMRPPTGWLYSVRVEALAEGSDSPLDVMAEVDESGFLRFASPGRCTITRFDARRAFEGTHCTCNVFKARRYINVLDENAVRHFYGVTEDRYFQRLGDDAACVEAVFTDEPSFMAAYHFPLSDEWKQRVAVQDPYDDHFDRLPMIGWHPKLPESFRKRWGYDLLPELGSLFEGSSPRDLRVRHDFYQMQSETYAEAYFGLQQSLLDEKGIAFSGHVLAEESLTAHVACEGSLMADLKRMRIPGIDMLSSLPEQIMDSPRLLTCKYASSAAHAMGREQVMSESSEFEQHCAGRRVSLPEKRGAFAVQMALGVTTLTSYYQWHEEDPAERRRTLDFWARLAAVVRAGTHIADFAVLYPIRTAWADYKPTDQVISADAMDEPLKSVDTYLLRIARCILGAGLDFDFVDTRELIGSQHSERCLRIADECYSALIIPPGAVMCPKDLQVTEAFVKRGGWVLAFEPCSDFALPEVASPPTGTDTGSGSAPAQVIAGLEAEFPQRVKRVSLADDWLSFVRGAASDDVKIELNGDYLLARRSIYQNADVVLIVNGAGADASAMVEFAAGREVELWDPWEASLAVLASNIAEVIVPAYSAVVLVSQRNRA